MKIQKNRWQLLGVSMLLSFLFLGLCSKSSPLYPMNIWPDVNCFFTVGKSMLHGMIPYRDLYEQKGPILYFLYALAALISENSFVGAYILDAVSFGVFLFFSGLCVRLHLGENRMEYPIVIFLAAILTTTEAVAHGGSAEQMFLWTLMVPLYLVDKALCEDRILTSREAFAIGLCAGICLYVKFNLLGFFFGLALFVLAWYVLFDRQPKALPGVIGWFLGGIAAVSVPVFLYFLLHGAVGDFFTVYFYNNLFLYQKSEVSKLYFYFFYLFTSFRRNPLVALAVVAAVAWLVITVRKQYKLLTALILSALFLSVGVLGGGVFFIYYPMVFTVYTGFGFIALALLFRKIFGKYPWKPGKAAVAAANVALVAVLLVYAFFASNNTYLLGTSKEELPQYRFAEQIGQKENATLLNYGFLDGGFYFAADVLPSNLYFARLNLIFDEMEQEQKQIVEAGAVDFVVLQEQKLEDCGVDASHYRLLDSADMFLEGDTYTYYLYGKVN